MLVSHLRVFKVNESVHLWIVYDNRFTCVCGHSVSPCFYISLRQFGRFPWRITPSCLHDFNCKLFFLFFPLCTVMLEIPFVFLVTVFIIYFWEKKIPTFNNFMVLLLWLVSFCINYFFHTISIFAIKGGGEGRADS